MAKPKGNPHIIEIGEEGRHQCDETEGTRDKSTEGRCEMKCCVYKCDLLTLLVSQTTKRRYKDIFEFIMEASKKEDQNESFFVCDLGNILWQVQHWKEKLPNIQPFYAVKANPDPVLLKFLILLGVSFDCATEGEIRLVLESGACPADIVYAHPFKTPKGLRYAKSVGVDLMSVDSESETLKIHNIYPSARLLLRIKPMNVSSFFDFSLKYGCTLVEAKKTLQKAKDLNMNVVGVSFHVGSLTTNPKSFVSSILRAHMILDLSNSMGYNFTTVDIGGGFSGEDENNGLTDEITDEIKAILEENFKSKDIEVIAEPGCCIVRSAFSLVTTITGKKEPDDENNITQIKKHYYLNDGTYSSFNQYMEEYGIHMKPLLAETEVMRRPTYKSKLWGHSLCSTDVIREECLLPELNVGESLIWENMGAYSLSICSTFCGAPKPGTLYVFVWNDRLNTKWITNLKEIVDFLNEHAAVIYSNNKVFISC